MIIKQETAHQTPQELDGGGQLSVSNGPHLSLFYSLSILQDPSFPLLLHDKLQVPNSTRKAWSERDGRCDVCAAHLSQLKQEAVHMVLTLEQNDRSPSSPPGPAGHRGATPRDWAHLPSAGSSSSAPGAGPGHTKHGSKPNSLGVGSRVEKKNGSPDHVTKPHVPSSPSNGNGNIVSSGATQPHLYLDGNWSMSCANGVTLYPYQVCDHCHRHTIRFLLFSTIKQHVFLPQMKTSNPQNSNAS